jgi:hypothetical protein
VFSGEDIDHYFDKYVRSLPSAPLPFRSLPCCSDSIERAFVLAVTRSPCHCHSGCPAVFAIYANLRSKLL